MANDINARLASKLGSLQLELIFAQSQVSELEREKATLLVEAKKAEVQIKELEEKVKSLTPPKVVNEGPAQ